MSRRNPTLEDRIEELERMVALLRTHKHDGRGKAVVEVWEAEDVVDSALYDLKKKHKVDTDSPTP